MIDFASNSWNFDPPWKMRFLNITYSLSVTYVLQSDNIKSLSSKFLSILIKLSFKITVKIFSDIKLTWKSKSGMKCPNPKLGHDM